MLFIPGMDDTHEPTRWISIGWQALLITNRLRNRAQLLEKEQEDGPSNKESDANEKEEAERKESSG